jgi:hypothetical protein
MTKTMKWLAATLWIVGFSMFGYAAHAEEKMTGHYITGNELLEACTTNTDYAKHGCNSYIIGMTDAWIFGAKPAVCIPLGVTIGQLKDLVTQGLIDVPKYRHFSAAFSVGSILMNNYSCDDKPKITS